MPFTPTTPQAKDTPVTVVQSKTLDTYQILSVQMSLNPGSVAEARCIVFWSKGYKDGSGKFVSVTQELTELSGQPLVTALNATPSGSSVYQVVKTALWALMRSQGAVDAGAVS